MPSISQIPIHTAVDEAGVVSVNGAVSVQAYHRINENQPRCCMPRCLLPYALILPLAEL